MPLFEDLQSGSGTDNEKVSIDDATSSVILPDQETMNAEVKQILQTHINELPAVYRGIISMFHLNEMSYTEISEVMNFTGRHCKKLFISRT